MRDPAPSTARRNGQAPPGRNLTAVELFTGAGGMAIGLAQAGFRHLALVEWDASACQTLRANHGVSAPPPERWPIFEADARAFDYAALAQEVDLLAGGVPCQPFSIGGKHRGHSDERNMFPEVARAVRELRPKAVLLENVRGLLRPKFARYFSYIIAILASPEIPPRPGEDWAEHLKRLERAKRRSGLTYRVHFKRVNAADYGVPQTRERVFIVALRDDLESEWEFPEPTHSASALDWAQNVSGEYWAMHRLRPKGRPARAGRGIPVPQTELFGDTRRRWLTVRDAIADLPAPAKRRGADEPDLTHFHIPGARIYNGHTGSPLDSPAKTLKAGDHGVPGGENMLARDDGTVRYFTIRESARLQGFPDAYRFPGSWTESMRQIGNAVPVSVARILGEHLGDTLRGVRPHPDVRIPIQSPR